VILTARVRFVDERAGAMFQRGKPRCLKTFSDFSVRVGSKRRLGIFKQGFGKRPKLLSRLRLVSNHETAAQSGERVILSRVLIT
jgi:hypothetical protein